MCGCHCLVLCVLDGWARLQVGGDHGGGGAEWAFPATLREILVLLSFGLRSFGRYEA